MEYTSMTNTWGRWLVLFFGRSGGHEIDFFLTSPRRPAGLHVGYAPYFLSMLAHRVEITLVLIVALILHGSYVLVIGLGLTALPLSHLANVVLAGKCGSGGLS